LRGVQDCLAQGDQEIGGLALDQALFDQLATSLGKQHLAAQERDQALEVLDHPIEAIVPHIDGDIKIETVVDRGEKKPPLVRHDSFLWLPAVRPPLAFATAGLSRR
jgi:hypothetical protein